MKIARRRFVRWLLLHISFVRDRGGAEGRSRAPRLMTVVRLKLASVSANLVPAHTYDVECPSMFDLYSKLCGRFWAVEVIMFHKSCMQQRKVCVFFPVERARHLSVDLLLVVSDVIGSCVAVIPGVAEGRRIWSDGVGTCERGSLPGKGRNSALASSSGPDSGVRSPDISTSCALARHEKINGTKYRGENAYLYLSPFFFVDRAGVCAREQGVSQVLHVALLVDVAAVTVALSDPTSRP